jgi:2-amino-4-hydroxy-6-hydroxymethyldihydropteridine diphosphokinase
MKRADWKWQILLTVPPHRPSAAAGAANRMTDPVTAYLGIGSNLDDPLAQVTRAVNELAHCKGIRVLRCSPWYGSQAVGPGAQPDYVNGAIEINTVLEPVALLRALQEIEQQHGRKRDVRWGARTLDLDILLYGDAVITGPDLQVPHPRLHERAFVLKPLADLCPTHEIPCPSSGKNETITQLLSHLPGQGIWLLEIPH